MVFNPENAYTSKVIAICNQKGGVGKTTTTINLGASLAKLGKKCLLVDLDPQGALSAGLGLAHNELDKTIYNLLIDSSLDPFTIVTTTEVKDLELLPGNIDLSAAEIQLVTEVGREQVLNRVLTRIASKYDYILLDCQPSLGLLTVNALTAADKVLIPMECEFFSLRGLALLQNTVNKIKERLNFKLGIIGILVTMYDARTIHAKEVMQRLKENFGDLIFNSVISRTIKFPETTVAGKPIITWAPESKGAQAYLALAQEVIERSSII